MQAELIREKEGLCGILFSAISILLSCHLCYIVYSRHVEISLPKRREFLAEALDA